MMSLDEVIECVAKHRTPYVCITGGEPLLQNDIHKLIKKLCDKDFIVSLETSGDLSCKDVDPRVLKIIDIKTPDSGEEGKYHLDNLKLNHKNIEYKFVISSEKDFEWSENFVHENRLHEKGLILYSPSFKKISEEWLAKKILSESRNARLQLQLHKYIWSPDEQGV
jgi:7-carboxy-7-deazaguanine synthase